MKSESQSRRIGRREYLAGGVSVALAALAGCSGDGDSSGDSGDDDSSGDSGDGDSSGDSGDSSNTETETGDGGVAILDRKFDNFTQTNPDVAQFNRFNPNNAADRVSEIIYDPLAGYNQQTGEWEYLLADDLSVQESSATLTLSDQYTWHNGDSVTASDLVTQFKIARVTDDPLWDFVSSVEATGDYEVTFGMDSATNQNILKTHILDTYVSTPESVFGEKLSAVQDASDDEQSQVLTSEILEWGWKDPIGNGPFQLEEAVTQRFELSRFPDHPNADKINFNQYHVKYVTLQEKTQMAISGQLDGGSGANTSVTNRNQIPDHYEFVTYTGYNGDGHFFQFDDPLTGNIHFRKAYQHLIDQVKMNRTVRTPNTQGFTWEPHTLQTGIMENQADTYLDGVIDGFTEYNGGAERAAEVLREGGFSKSNGSWQLPNGDDTSLEIIVVQGNPSLTGQAGYVAEQMNDFGISTNVRGVDFSTYFDAYQTGNFQVTIWLWGGGNPDPYFHFSNLLDSIAGPIGYPETIEVPMPVGDPDGSMQSVNPREKLEQLATTIDEEEYQTLIQELAWIFNQSAPLLQGVDALWNSLISRDGWNWPSSDSDALAVRPAPAWLPKKGKITAEE
ncbi:ABC transporter substrate-binding protein [Halovenus marina]|uniref:ABC transporter substrate-binding protein n=1 Tax=Halovenus marina TaxID=3396621 RepID=UPI003F54F1F7